FAGAIGLLWIQFFLEIGFTESRNELFLCGTNRDPFVVLYNQFAANFRRSVREPSRFPPLFVRPQCRVVWAVGRNVVAFAPFRHEYQKEKTATRNKNSHIFSGQRNLTSVPPSITLC